MDDIQDFTDLLGEHNDPCQVCMSVCVIPTNILIGWGGVRK